MECIRKVLCGSLREIRQRNLIIAEFREGPQMQNRDIKKTIYFEEHYNVDIDSLHSIEEIDKVIEDKIGRKLEVKDIKIFPIKKYERDIDYVF